MERAQLSTRSTIIEGQAKRQKIRHIGAEASKRPLPFGQGNPWKRNLSGEIVSRRLSSEILLSRE